MSTRAAFPGLDLDIAHPARIGRRRQDEPLPLRPPNWSFLSRYARPLAWWGVLVFCGGFWYSLLHMLRIA